MTKHTKEQCFKLVGYPDWFKDRRKEKGSWSGRGHAAVARADLAHVPETNHQGAGTGPGGADITSSLGAVPSASLLGAGTWYRVPAEQPGIQHLETSSSGTSNGIQGAGNGSNSIPSGSDPNKGSASAYVAYQEGTSNGSGNNNIT
jgi:hypothetical protein